MSFKNVTRDLCFYLEMRAGDTGCDLFEERLLDADELRRLDHIQDLLNLSQEHHLKTHQNTRFVSSPEYGHMTNIKKKKCLKRQRDIRALFCLTSFCVQVFGQYLSSPLMICRGDIKHINRNKHGSYYLSRGTG